jgi:hypothetical protein
LRKHLLHYNRIACHGNCRELTWRANELTQRTNEVLWSTNEGKQLTNERLQRTMKDSDVQMNARNVQIRDSGIQMKDSFALKPNRDADFGRKRRMTRPVPEGRLFGVAIVAAILFADLKRLNPITSVLPEATDHLR